MSDDQWTRMAADLDPSLTDIDADDELAWARLFEVLRAIEALTGEPGVDDGPR